MGGKLAFHCIFLSNVSSKEKDLRNKVTLTKHYNKGASLWNFPFLWKPNSEEPLEYDWAAGELEEVHH